MNPPARATALKVERFPTEMPGRSTLDFYDRNAAVYAQTTSALSLMAEIERFAALVPPGAKVLDVGCGGGRDLLALRQTGLNPTGLEMAEKLASIARRHSGCRVVVGDMRDPPFAERSFGGLWAAASLLHLKGDEMLPTLKRLRRLLKSGGAFFASLKMGTGSERSPDGRLFTYVMPGEWEALLAAAGFGEVEITSEVIKSRKIGEPASAWLQSLSRVP